MALIFEWDSNKARENLLKHALSFDEAVSAFRDPFSLTIPDPLHSVDEERFILMGYSQTNRLTVVVHTFREGRIRLISARGATKTESRQYEEKGQ